MLVDFDDWMKLNEEPKPILVDLSDKKEESLTALNGGGWTPRLNVLDGLRVCLDGFVWMAAG